MRSIVGCVGDLLVEIMRQNRDEPLGETGIFIGPFPSGASGIFIDAVARLGIGARFVGTVGNDDFGELIINRFNRDGVDTSHIQRSDEYTTGVAFVTYFADGSRKFIYHLGNAATGQISPDNVKPEYFNDVSYLHVVGSTMFINEQSAGACIKAIDIVKSRAGKVSFDPNFRPELLSVEEVKERFHPVLTKSDIIFPTTDELKILTGEKDIKEACTKLLDTGFEIVAIKQGKDGSTVYTKKEEFHAPAFEVEEIDPTGAGDCYCAGFLAGLIKGLDLKHTALFANAVGALAVTKKGPMEGAPKEKEVDELLGQSSQ
jgi:sugar/nucleoside kinase (ribokinase family)